MGMGSAQGEPEASSCANCSSSFKETGQRTALCPSCSKPARDYDSTQASLQARPYDSCIPVDEANKARVQPPEHAAPMLAAELEGLASVVDALCGHPNVPQPLKARLLIVLSQLWRGASSAATTLAMAMQTAPSVRESVLHSQKGALLAELATLHEHAAAQAAAHQETRTKLRECRQKLSKQGWTLLHDRARLSSERNRLGRELDGALKYNETITQMYHKAAKTHAPTSPRTSGGARPVPLSKQRAPSSRSPASARGPQMQARDGAIAAAEAGEAALGLGAEHVQRMQRTDHAGRQTKGAQVLNNIVGDCHSAFGGEYAVGDGGNDGAGVGGGWGGSMGVGGVGGGPRVGGGCCGFGGGGGFSGDSGGGGGGSLGADSHEQHWRGCAQALNTLPVQHVATGLASPHLAAQQDHFSVPYALAAIDAEDISPCDPPAAADVALRGAIASLPVAAGFAGTSRPRGATPPLPAAMASMEGVCAGEPGLEKRQLPRPALTPGALHNPFSPALPFSFSLPLAERPRGRHPGAVTVTTLTSQPSSAPEYHKGLAPIAWPSTQDGDVGDGAWPVNCSSSKHGCIVTSPAAFMPTGKPQRSPRYGLKTMSPRAAVAGGTGFFGMGSQSQSMGQSMHAALVRLGPS